MCLGGSVCRSLSASAEVVRYEVTIDNTWSAETHPDAYEGIVDPHFSHLAGAGTVRMAETGAIDILTGETQVAIDAGTAFNNYSFKQWFPAPSITRLTIEVSDTHPLVTLVSIELEYAPDPARIVEWVQEAYDKTNEIMQALECRD